MAKRVTQEDIRYINDVYYVCRNYTETAAKTGWSASTVRKYVIKDYSPIHEDNIQRFNPETDFNPNVDFTPFINTKEWGDLCVLSDDEYDEIKKLWEEIRI